MTGRLSSDEMKEMIDCCSSQSCGDESAQSCDGLEDWIGVVTQSLRTTNNSSFLPEKQQNDFWLLGHVFWNEACASLIVDEAARTKWLHHRYRVHVTCHLDSRLLGKKKFQELLEELIPLMEKYIDAATNHLRNELSLFEADSDGVGSEDASDSQVFFVQLV